MVRQLLYEELLYRVRVLEREDIWRRQAEAALLKTREKLEAEIKRRKSELEALKQAYEAQIAAQTAACRLLEAREERYRRLFERSPDFTFVIDAEFCLLEASPSVQGFLDYPVDALAGKKFNELNLLSARSKERADAYLMRLFSGDKLPPAIFEFVARSGARRHGELAATPIFDQNEVGQLICAVRDVGSRLRIGKAILEKKRLQGEMEMAWSVSSGLQGPLAAIAAQAELILAHIEKDHPAHELAGNLRSKADTLSELILHFGGLNPRPCRHA
jgi:PAS domain S-box-containing protein